VKDSAPGIEYNRVYFPGVSGSSIPLKNSTEKKLWVLVPEGALPGVVTINLFDDEVTESPVTLTVMAPVVESIEPSSGIVGDTVIIRGRNFRIEPEKNKVRFNPVNTTLTNPAGLAKVLSASSVELRVIVPLDSRTGKMSVFGFEGPEFTILPPSITSIEPLTGIVGDTISILGRGFSEAQSMHVHFEGSGMDATVLPVSTSRKLHVIVPEDAKDGIITVKYSSTAIAPLTSDQVFEVYPSIADISPLNGISGMTVTINGYAFSHTVTDNKVKFGDLTAQVISASATQLKAVVPAGTVTGKVTVEVKNRLGTGPVFEISADGTPLVFSILPTSGPIGSVVSIKGDYFSAVASENSVRFGSDAQAEVLGASKTELTVKVPVGAVDGPVTVTKENKKGTGPDFTLSTRALPVITSITPGLVEPGASFTIHGGNFTTFTNDINIFSTIALGSGNILKPLTATNTEITATLPASAKVGEWEIYITQYNQNSNNNKTITIKGEPQITSLSATEGFANSNLILTGTEFHNIENKNTVKFSNVNGDVVASFVNESDGNQNQIQVYAPDITPGVYDVTVTAFGEVSNAISYTIKEKPAAVKNVFYSRAILVAPNTIKLEKAIFDPPQVQTVYQTPGTGSASIKSLVVDILNSKTYFSTISGIISRSNLDNTGAVQLYTGQSALNDLTLDAANSKLYWSRAANIWKGDVKTIAEGGAAATTIYTATGTSPSVRGLTYSPIDNKIYFCEVSSGISSIASIDLDDTPPYVKTMIVPAVSLLPVDIKIDHTNGKLFILCGSSATLQTGRRTIYMANLDGSDLTVFHTIPGSGTDPSLQGIALDIQDQYVYWLKNIDDVTDGPKGIYRKRYNQSVIPGTDPPAVIQKVYDVSDLSAQPIVYGGLAIEDASGQSPSQRKKSGSSHRAFSFSMTIELTNYNED
jgi:hypothetical protein